MRSRRVDPQGRRPADFRRTPHPPVSAQSRQSERRLCLGGSGRGDGKGIAYTPEALAEPFLRSVQLVRVLEDWSRHRSRASSSITLGTGRCGKSSRLHQHDPRHKRLGVAQEFTQESFCQGPNGRVLIGFSIAHDPF
jgi:DNA-binding transcriptional LysR family regulator